jgi:hypothetical protein
VDVCADKEMAGTLYPLIQIFSSVSVPKLDESLHAHKEKCFLTTDFLQLPQRFSPLLASKLFEKLALMITSTRYPLVTPASMTSAAIGRGPTPAPSVLSSPSVAKSLPIESLTNASMKKNASTDFFSQVPLNLLGKLSSFLLATYFAQVNSNSENLPEVTEADLARGNGDTMPSTYKLTTLSTLPSPLSAAKQLAVSSPRSKFSPRLSPLSSDPFVNRNVDADCPRNASGPLPQSEGNIPASNQDAEALARPIRVSNTVGSLCCLVNSTDFFFFCA